MRYGCAALLMLMSSAATASAQVQVEVAAPAPTVDARAQVQLLAQNLEALALAKKSEARVSPDEVVARLLSFDSNRDGKVTVDELSERMQGLVARGDRGADGALDASEIRSLAQAPQQVRIQGLGGGYSFGDTGSLSTRTHIENTIDDLRLAPQANQEARRIAAAFADDLERTAHANLRTAVAPLVTEAQLTEFESNLKRTGARTIRFTTNNGGTATQMQTLTIAADPTGLLRRYGLTSEQMKIAAAAAETFKAEQQLDDARRSALVARLSGILTEEESDNFRAALARRPLVKGLGALGSIQVGIREETIRTEFPGNGVPVREIGFTTAASR